MLHETTDLKNSKLKYTKEFFASYYQVDLETFHKWIQLFCPDLWNNGYKKRRKFSSEDRIYIYSQLGMYSFEEGIPRNHKELADFIYSDTSWKNSKKYQEIKLQLEDHFPNGEFQLNILPPKIVTDILTEEIENYSRSGQDFDFYEQRTNKMHHLMTRYGNMTEHQKQVKIRWFRMWLSKSNR